MSNAQATTLAAFRDALEHQGTEFMPAAPARDDCAQIRFIGSFEGRPVIWDATIIALEHPRTILTPGSDADTGKQFMEIDAGEGVVRNIRVGLQLDLIDLQTIHKTIIMIRKYKRLQTGRHEFAYRSLLR